MIRATSTFNKTINGASRLDLPTSIDPQNILPIARPALFLFYSASRKGSVNASDEASNFDGDHAGMRGLLTRCVNLSNLT